MKESVTQLEIRARKLRAIALKMAYAAGSEGAHIGPAFSIMDVMTVLYFDVMNYQDANHDWENRDRLILSKGHACLGLYAPLVMCGCLTQEQASSFNRPHTNIAGHPSGKGVKGIEHPAGSLGHGLSVGCGMAKAAKLTDKRYDIYVVIGDGEANEGSIWEAAMFAAQHKLDNLTVVVDANGFQYSGPTREMMNMDPMIDKWTSFGWSVSEINGNDIVEIRDALNKGKKHPGKPTCILARTIKGFGVPLFEGNQWHHGVITRDVLDQTLLELENRRLAQ